MKINRILLYAILSIIIIIAILLVYAGNPSFQLQGKYAMITIRNGSTGDEAIIEDINEITNFISELNRSCGSIKGLNIIAMGYKYAIILKRGLFEKSFIIKDENSIYKGIFKYKLDKDFIKIIEEYFRGLSH